MEHYKLVDDVQKSSAFRQFLENKKITGMGACGPEWWIVHSKIIWKTILNN